MINALIIAFEFPPVNTAGVHRSAKFVKYLPSYGINPVVLTVDPDDAARTFAAPLEPGLAAQVATTVRVYPIAAPSGGPPPASRIGKFLSVFSRVEDPIAVRMRPALARALPAIMAQHEPQVVYASLPPFSAGGLALDIAERYQLPLVVDMRDGWSHWCAGAFPSYLHWARIHAKERALFNAATSVVTVTTQLAEIFRRSHPHLPRDHFRVVPNGYDGLLEIPDVCAIERSSCTREIRIGYVGNYYYTPEARDIALTPWWKRRGHRKIQYQPVREDWLYRSPFFFLRALGELRRRRPSLGDRITFVHVGKVPAWLPSMVAELGLSEAVKYFGVVPHSEVLSVSKTFDALLCTSVKVEGGEDYALASKTFDYVLSGRPILGFVTRGAQREFLAGSGMSLIADPDDLGACMNALASLVESDVALRPNRPFLDGYRRRAGAERMAQIMSEAAGRSANRALS
jgi:glycosyltransferase involved in cell wall biosynthesis